jgi:hypothetical protein
MRARDHAKSPPNSREIRTTPSSTFIVRQVWIAASL